MYKVNPILAVDSYKLGYMTMYPEGTTKVYCNLTPRSTKRLSDSMPKGFYDGKVVVYGVSSSIQEIAQAFAEGFFSRPIGEVLAEFAAAVQPFLGDNSPDLLLENAAKPTRAWVPRGFIANVLKDGDGFQMALHYSFSWGKYITRTHYSK